MSSQQLSIEQLSRELGDSRRCMTRFVDEASSLSLKIVELASQLEIVSEQERVGVEAQLRKIIADHSAVVDQIATQAVKNHAMEQAATALRYSQR